MEEDLQEKYQGKPLANVEQKTHLAADAAHLLSEWLDTISIEFVKQGVLEPFSITSRYEEMAIRKLQAKGATAKLTYEVVLREIESIGSPVKIVRDYIEENNPTRKRFLLRDTQEDDKQEIQLERRGPIDLENTAKKTGFYIFSFLLISAVLTYIFLDVLTLFVPLWNINRNAYALVIGGLIPSILFIAVEITSGITGLTIINVQHYRNFRYLFSNCLIFLAGIQTIFGLELKIMGPNNTPYTGWEIDSVNNVSIILWVMVLVVQLVIFFRDQAPGLVPINTEIPSVARFLTPSYGFAAIAFISTFIGFILLLPRDNFSIYGTSTFETNTVKASYILFLVALLMALISGSVDLEKKYNISRRKQVFLLLVAFSFLVRFTRIIYERKYPYYTDNNVYVGQKLTIPSNYYPIFPILLILWILIYGSIIISYYSQEIESAKQKIINLKEDMRVDKNAI